MSDILEDQKIHLIVKDYKRMFEEHEKIIAIGKEFQQQLIAKEKELAKVKMELEATKEELKSVKSKGAPDEKQKKDIRIQLNEIKTRCIALHNRYQKDIGTVEGLLNNLRDIEQLFINP